MVTRLKECSMRETLRSCERRCAIASARLEFLRLEGHTVAVGAGLALLGLPGLVEAEFAAVALDLLAVGRARDRALFGAGLAHVDDALVAAHAVVTWELAADGARA